MTIDWKGAAKEIVKGVATAFGTAVVQRGTNNDLNKREDECRGWRRRVRELRDSLAGVDWGQSLPDQSKAALRELLAFYSDKVEAI